jgi:citrate synthase
MAEKAILKIGDKEYELPVIEGSEKEKAIDITKLRGQSGYVTIDSGYLNTGACTSAITFLDGELGILRYRGIPLSNSLKIYIYRGSSFINLWEITKPQ